MQRHQPNKKEGKKGNSIEDMAVKKIVQFETAVKKREGGGFMVRRPVGDKIDMVDPFLMLDHLGPTVYGPGEAIGAPDHPHRGFETVTYIIDGGMHHHDSAGNEGNLKPGWVQWMTAGSGVVHSEMPTDELLETGGRSEGFQLWVNLPKKYKMVPPRYQDTPPESIPVVSSKDGKTEIKVIAGKCLGTSAVIQTRIPILFLDIHVTKGASFVVDIPPKHNAFAYVWRGEGLLGEEKKEAKMGQVALLTQDGESFKLEASSGQDLHVFILAGEPINEPVARYGPFVMNTQEELQQAFNDYRSGKLGEIEGSEERYMKTQNAVSKGKKTGNYYEH